MIAPHWFDTFVGLSGVGALLGSLAVWAYRPVRYGSRTHQPRKKERTSMYTFADDQQDWDFDDRELHDYGSDTWPLDTERPTEEVTR